MFEGKEARNSEDCFEITGLFSPTVGPIIRRLQSDTTGHKWLINRRVGRVDISSDLLFIIYCFSTFVISESSELLSLVRARSDVQAGLWPGSPGQTWCQLPSPAPLTTTTGWPGIVRSSATRWYIRDITETSHKQQQYCNYLSQPVSVSVYHGVDYQTVITVFCVKTNNNNVCITTACPLLTQHSQPWPEQEKLTSNQHTDSPGLYKID